MAQKYNVDVNKISKPGNVGIGGIFVGLGSSNRESLYAVRGTGSGNVVIYDKVLYELVMGSINNIDPAGGTFTTSGYATTNKKTHGDGTVETGLDLSPSTVTVGPNTSTASTQSGSWTITQYDSAKGSYVGAADTLSWTQVKDYPTGITLTISPKSTIPAKGGSITTALTNYTYNVKCNYKSGNNNVDITSDSNLTITANVTGVTAGSKGTTASTETNAGTIRFTATYVCNGKTVTSVKDVTIKQDLNKIESYNNPTFTLSPGETTLSAGGSSVTGSVSNVKQKRNWSSTSVDEITLTKNASSNGYTESWTNQVVSCSSLGTTVKDRTLLKTTSVTVSSTNGGNASSSYNVYQEANAITSYGNPDFDLSPGNTTLPASGGSVTGSISTPIQTRYYTSGDNDSINPSYTSSWTAQTVSCNSLETTITGETTLNTTQITVTANGKSTTKSYVVKQQANGIDSYDNPTFTLSPGNTTLPASGGSVTGGVSNVKQVRRYTSKSTDTVTLTAGASSNGYSVSWTNQTISCNSRGTTTGNILTLGTTTAVVSSTNGGSSSSQYTVYQQANEFPSSTVWGSLILTSASFGCSDVPCTGGTVYPATGGTVSQNRTRYYTSGSYTADTPSVEASVSISQTAFTGSNLGKTDTDRTSLGNTTATWTSNGESDSKTITVYQQANTHTDSWNNPSVSLSENPGTQITNAAQRVTVTASATQSGTRTWCTNQSSPISNSSFSWSWSQDGTSSYCTATTDNNVNYIDFSTNGGTQSRTSPVFTATATGAGSKTGFRSVFITQAGEDKPSPSVNDVGISFSTFPPPTPPTPSGTLFSIMNSTLYYITGSFTGVEGSSSMSFGESFGKNPGYRQEYTFDTPVYIKSIYMTLQNIPSGGSNVIYLRNMSTTQSYLTLNKSGSSAGYVTYSNENCNYQLDPNSTMYEIVVG